jgi:hypothetical protein
MAKSNAGRPTKMTENTVNKLEEAFLMGCSDAEACFFADISKQTLYTYQEKNPEFVDRKERLKSNPLFLSRRIQLEALKDESNAVGQQLTADKIINRHEGIKQRLEHANADGQPFKTETAVKFNFVPVGPND